ncbi:MAG: hypothetical protein COT59_00375 [Candidatus Nealsonbacteria bacterium CG09_land_8_20_14_0_10_42_14]|uniref:Metallo-beta-lactamase domain-containing protein n=1 Tax=Candidatus Nealsonbacteria bacterium CG09_land_8_20_14_0_10_42_14 TaxID=1974707 RepID=A0A2H0WXU0_9BACT|nr:MAG: hypothetical protein COT59_00375 [Candidatus Nealsonbacteria bacterium CG09_land_8_20_14_0_10_42_14]
MKYMKKKSVLIILGILVGFNVLAWIGVFQLSQANLEVTFFDVGQGDSIFIETPSGHQILIDGGPTSVVLEKLGKEMPFWDRTIDLVVLTHPEHDHYGGLLEVLKRYKVENILWTGVLRDTAEYEKWQKLIQEESAEIFIAQAGQQIEGGETSISILWPVESLDGQSVSNTNNTSIVARLVFGESSFLFTGDIYQSVERELLNLVKQRLESDVLKVGHHGSKTSSAEEFIEKVAPEIAVIQAGRDNSYGHPHEITLATLEKYGINILRTDLDGDIKIISDGYAVSTIQN